MTVIATDGLTIASDGLVTFGHERSIRAEQKIKAAYGRLYAFSGAAPFFDAVIEWHRLMGPYPWKDIPKGTDSWSLLVVHSPDFIEHIHSDNGLPSRVNPPFAIGAGAEFAVGAMHAGISPKEAVRIACRCCITCGGPITVVDITKALHIPNLRAAE